MQWTLFSSSIFHICFQDCLFAVKIIDLVSQNLTTPVWNYPPIQETENYYQPTRSPLKVLLVPHLFVESSPLSQIYIPALPIACLSVCCDSTYSVYLWCNPMQLNKSTIKVSILIFYLLGALHCFANFILKKMS